MIQHLKVQISDFEKLIANAEMLNLSVSASSVGWHIDHCLLTIYGITNVLKQSNANDYKWQFKVPRLLVLTFKKIPRGKAKAPKVVSPISFTTDEIKKHLVSAEKQIAELQNLGKNQFFKHPYLGDMKLNQSIKFLTIHNNHHLKIINDIINANKK